VGLADIFFWVLLAALLVGVIATIARSSSGGGGGGGGGTGMAGITAFHDFSPADKQRAIEIVVEKKAGKRWMEQESGKEKDPENPPAEKAGTPEPGVDTGASPAKP
jgi:hypothetical protein